MSVPASKIELLSAIEKNYSKLSGYLNKLPIEITSEPSMEGHAQGTMMSVDNLVSYLVGWNELVIKWITLDKAGRPIDFPETGYKWNQLGLLAQKFYIDYSKLSYSELLRLFQQVKDDIISLINEYDETALYGKEWYGKWTLGRMIQFNTSSPYANACARLRKWAKEKNIKLK